MDKPPKPLKRLFTPATKLAVVQRYEAGERPAALAREFDIRPTLVHQWVDDYRKGGSGGLKRPGRPSRVDKAAALAPPVAGPDTERDDPLMLAQRRIAALEQRIGQQQLELDFFRQALRHIGAESGHAGAPVSTLSSGRGRKAG
jgi:transposase-like protein